MHCKTFYTGCFHRHGLLSLYRGIMAGNEAYTTRRCVCGVSVVLYGELLWVALNAGRRIEDTDQTRLGSWFDTLLNLNLVSDVVFISTKNGAWCTCYHDYFNMLLTCKTYILVYRFRIIGKHSWILCALKWDKYGLQLCSSQVFQ